MAITKLDVTIKKPTINCSIQKKEIKCSFREVLFTYNEDYEVNFLANHLEGAGNIKITEDEQNKKVIIDDTHNHDLQYLKKNEKAVDSSKLDGKDSSYYTTAQNINYDNSTSGLSSTNIQDAIDELDNALDNLSTDAKDIIYDNTTSGLSAGNVQSAIDEVVSDLVSHINNQNNPHNVTASQIGGQNILNELLDVDGEGSGLDADLLDGKEASDFLPVDATNSLSATIDGQKWLFVSGQGSVSFPKQIFMKVKNSGNQSLPTNTWVKVIFDVIEDDFYSMWDIENNRAIIPEDGIYLIYTRIDFYNIGTDKRGLMRFKLNGSESVGYVGLWAGGGATMSIQSMYVLKLSQGDFIEVEADQQSGYTRDLRGREFIIIKLA